MERKIKIGTKGPYHLHEIHRSCSVLRSDHHPIGIVKDFFYRIEFQQRGSPHVHMIEDAPNYQQKKNSEKGILDFVDYYLKCEKNEDDKLTGLQVHKHSQTCKKGGKSVCRFGFPLPPLEKTMILEPLESDVDKYKKMFDEVQKKLNDLKMTLIYHTRNS